MICILRNGLIISALLLALLVSTAFGDLFMPGHYLELTHPEHAYLFGFIQADGHLYRNPKSPNKGKLQVEVSARDKDALEKIQAVLSGMGINSSITCRSRVTNFTKGELSHTFTLTACDMHFRQELERLGIPTGKKSKGVSTPCVPFSEVDYFRGVIDGDGSLGVTKQGLPFLGLVTASESMANNYITFLEKVTGHHILAKRNKRDKVYNLLLLNEKAIKVIKVLYYDGCLALERKKEKAVEALKWERPADKPMIDFEKKRWAPEDDLFLLSVSVDEASEKLGRTRKSVASRKWRLTGKCT